MQHGKMNQHSPMMVTCCQPTRININYNYQYALQIQQRTPSAYCEDKGNLEESPFHAAGTFWILSFSGGGSFNWLLGDGLYPAGKQDPTWPVGFKTGNQDGEVFIFSHLPPQYYLAWLLCSPHPALMPLLPPLLLELLTMTHSPYLLLFPHLSYEISANMQMMWPSSRSWPPPIPNCTNKSPTFKL